MSAAEKVGLGAALSDRVNPIVLQEVRRGLRTRVFSFSFSLVLTACALIALIAFGTYHAGSSGDSGRGTFLAVFACLAAVGFFMLPYSAYRSLVREREEKTWALLVLTGLTPRRILAGKVGSFALQAGLYASAIAPFLLFAYLLQGITLVVVLALLGAATAFHLFLTVLAVALATLGESRLVRGALHFSVLGALLFASITGFSVSVGLVQNGPDVPEMLLVLGVASWFMLAYGLILFAMAVSRLTFEADNHALWPRLALLVHFAGTAALAAMSNKMEVHITFGLGGLAHAFIAGLLCAGGSPGLSQRLRSHRPRVSLFGLLLPGASGGLNFAVLLTLLFAGASAVLVAQGWTSHAEVYLCGVVAAAALSVTYLSLPVIIGRGPLRRFFPTPAYLQVLGVLLAVCGAGVPPLVALIADFKVDHEGLNYLNPVVAVGHMLERADWTKVAILWGLALTLFWAAHRIARARDGEAENG